MGRFIGSPQLSLRCLLNRVELTAVSDVLTVLEQQQICAADKVAQMRNKNVRCTFDCIYS